MGAYKGIRNNAPPLKPKKHKRPPGAPVKKETLEKGIVKRIEGEFSRPELVEFFEASDDPRFSGLVRQMIAPENYLETKRSLFSMAKAEGISARELMEFMYRHSAGLGLLRIARNLPEIMEDTAIDARTLTHECHACDGLGQVEKVKGEDRVVKTCPVCHGKGEVREKGDIENRKIIWDSTGIIKKGGGANVSIPISFGGERTDSFEGLVGRANDAMGGAARPALVESTAEVVQEGGKGEDS